MFGFENESNNYSNEKPQNLYKHLTCTIHFRDKFMHFSIDMKFSNVLKNYQIFSQFSQATFALNEIKNPINCKS